MASAEQECLIAFGANQGDREQMLARALGVLGGEGFANCRASRLYVTRPIGGPGVQDVYSNAVIRASTALSPPQIVSKLLSVEAACGRERGQRWAPRTIDLDLLLLGQQTFDGPLVQLPHPRMTCRRFVLEPACEIASEMRHPWSGATLGELSRAIAQASPRTAVWLWPDETTAEAAGLLAEVQKQLCERGEAAHFLRTDSGEFQPDRLARWAGEAGSRDWHILLLADPLQLKRLSFRPGLVIGWNRPLGGGSLEGHSIAQAELALRDLALQKSKEHVGAVVLLAPELAEAARELAAALQAVAEFWDSAG